MLGQFGSCHQVQMRLRHRRIVALGECAPLILIKPELIETPHVSGDMECYFMTSLVCLDPFWQVGHPAIHIREIIRIPYQWVRSEFMWRFEGWECFSCWWPSDQIHIWLIHIYRFRNHSEVVANLITYR